MAIADELIALLGFEVTGEDAVRRYEAALGRVNARLSDMAKTAGMVAGAAAAAVAAGMGFMGREVINTSAQFESFQATLETIEGSAQKARASLDWITAFAKTTPYDVSQVTESFVKLKAYGIDPLANDTLRILGDTASAMGKDLNAAVEMFADASTGEFERLKEFGIKASAQGDQVTFSWTKNGQELTKTVKKNATEVRKFLLDTMGDRFAGAMDRQSRTWNGMMSNLSDTWTNFQRKVGEAGFFDNVKNKLQGVMGVIDRLDKEGKLDRWATALSNSLSWSADVIWAVVTRIGENIEFLIEHFDTLKPVLIAIGVALGALTAYAFPLIAGFIALGLVVDDFLAYLQGGESVIGRFIDWIKQLPENLSAAAGAFGNWIRSVDWSALGQSAGRLLVDAIVLTVTTYVTAWSAVGEYIVGFFRDMDWSAVAQAIVAGFQAGQDLLLGYWAGVGLRINELIKEWFNVDLIAIGQKMAQDILTGLQTLGGQIKEWFTSLFQMPDWLKKIMGEGGPGAEPVKPTVYGTGEATPNPDVGQSVPLDTEALDYKLQLQQEEWNRVVNNLNGNLQKMVPDKAVDATITDARQDNRQFPVNTTVTVNQNVTQATDAPRRAAEATGQAVQQSVAGQRTQIEQEPAF